MGMWYHRIHPPKAQFSPGELGLPGTYMQPLGYFGTRNNVLMSFLAKPGSDVTDTLEYHQSSKSIGATMFFPEVISTHTHTLSQFSPSDSFKQWQGPGSGGERLATIVAELESWRKLILVVSVLLSVGLKPPPGIWQPYYLGTSMGHFHALENG